MVVMSSPVTPLPLTVTVLAALWVGPGRSQPPEPGCDNGKLSLDRDLPADAVHWDCSVFTWPEATQRLPSIDTVYDPEPARQICMDKSIYYNHTIPNSGAYRPVMAESGEYLYCPPQRWLNNLHHGVIVLLYHPCAPVHERLYLSVLARSCLPEYIITSHPQLSKHMPIALVSWGHTLELSTVASLDVCDWLEIQKKTRGRTTGSVSQSRKYNLLLTWQVKQHQQQHTHPEEHSTKTKESVRQCCEHTISSLLKGATEAQPESSRTKEIKNRLKRAAVQETQEKVKGDSKRDNTTQALSFLIKQTDRNILRPTQGVQNSNSTPGPSAGSPPLNRPLSDPSGPKEPSPQSKIQNLNQGFTSRPTAPSTRSTLKSDSIGFEATQPSSKHINPRKPKPSAGTDVFADAVNSEPNNTASPKTLSSRDEGIDSAKHNMKEKNYRKDEITNGGMKDDKIVDIKERELKQKKTYSDTESQHKSKNTSFDSDSKSQSESQAQPQQHPNSKSDQYLPNTQDCDGCKAGEYCECTKDTGSRPQAAVVNKGFPRTPRTDEAVWAAAALGFLLVLLTLSVLHTRLYRNWRTMPSLYWHDPQQDYDSVADVIHRRLRIAKRRRKRGKRQECVLLPSSSSSDERL
ncbi:uncharacterized protein tp53i13 [Mastacembelus armatus]|uniref:Tumor protein p53 inducible protein 13 n=1 Tax=Mastacembelus armatus TaxID=205130 RepID=A0A3Q3KSE2_9TELE|nr:tumor protein p53-inducible protein 13 [Mastacembelus armatus]